MPKKRVKPQSALRKIENDVRATPADKIRAALCIAILDAYDEGNREKALVLSTIASSNRVKIEEKEIESEGEQGPKVSLSFLEGS